MTDVSFGWRRFEGTTPYNAAGSCMPAPTTLTPFPTSAVFDGNTWTSAVGTASVWTNSGVASFSFYEAGNLHLHEMNLGAVHVRDHRIRLRERLRVAAEGCGTLPADEPHGRRP